MVRWRFVNLFVFVFFFSSIGNGLSQSKTPILTLLAHDSFSVSKDLIKSFEEKNSVTLNILKIGDAGTALNQAILSKTNPLADVFFGVDNTFMSRALQSDIFQAYPSPMLKKIPDHLKLDPQNRLLPVDFGDICLNYDKKWFSEKGLPPPQELNDLIKPEYKGLTVVENPATSSPGLGFLITTVGMYGKSGYLDYWKKLRANDVYISTGWTDAYYGQFTRAKNGTRPIVVSYAGSPAAEVYYSEKELDDTPTAAICSPGMAFRQIEFVGVLKGTKQLNLSYSLVDFMLSSEFQKDIPLQMWVFPADPNIPLPEVFEKYAKQAEQPVVVSPDTIEAGREKWIDAWTEVVLR